MDTAGSGSADTAKTFLGYFAFIGLFTLILDRIDAPPQRERVPISSTKTIKVVLCSVIKLTQKLPRLTPGEIQGRIAWNHPPNEYNQPILPLTFRENGMLARLTCSSLICLLMATAVLAQRPSFNQWIESTTGQLEGQLLKSNGQVASNASVTLTSSSGATAQTTTDDRGMFAFSNAAPGVYGLTATTPGRYACCSIHFLSEDNGLPKATVVRLADIDESTVKSAVARYAGTGSGSPGDIRVSDYTELICPEPEFFRVSQYGDGMKGMVRRPGGSLSGAGSMNVMIFKSNVEVTRTLTEPNGSFVIEKLDPGTYSMMAVGPAGVGVISFDLIAGPSSILSNNQASSDQTLVSMLQGPSTGGLAFQVASTPAIAPIAPAVGEVAENDILPVGGMFPTGSPPGFGGGGSSGGGGLGIGLGDIAGLAGVGGVIAAIAIDDDQEVVPIIASPAAPN